MKKITINNQEFEETNASIPMTDWTWYQNKWYKPVEQFKVGDWITFYSEVDKTFYTSKIKEWTSHSYCKLNNGLEPFKHLLKKATSQEILEHLRTIAKEKGLVKGAKVKGIQSNSELLLHTIVQEDDNYYPETDEYAKSGIILYSNGKWAEKVEEPKFTFGGHEVSFKVIPNSRERPLKFVEVTCKGETGANYEIFNILENPLKRLPFGKVFTRGFTLKGKLDAQKHIPTIERGTESSYIDEIQIGCLVDKYENLVKIYEHCLTLLKWD